MPFRDCKPLPAFTERDILKFWSLVDRKGPNDCWLWTGGITPESYGCFCAQSRAFLAHRISYFLETKSDPFPSWCCHTCDVLYDVDDLTNRRCCNPSHLFLGTRKDNFADMIRKGRTASGDRNGSRTRLDRILRGKTHPRPSAKLTTEEVFLIRETYSKGDISQRKLGARFGVDHGTICRIVSKESWPHV